MSNKKFEIGDNLRFVLVVAIVWASLIIINLIK